MVRTRTRSDRLSRFPICTLWLQRAPPCRLAFPDAPSCDSSNALGSCMRRPLLGLLGLHPQLDPTFPHWRQALPLPVPGTTTTTPSVRKSLKITVPRAPPCPPLPLDVADIFDDFNAWSIFVPSGPHHTSTSTSASTNIGAELSLPHIPKTAMSEYSVYGPIELIIDRLRQPTFTLLSSFLPEYYSDDKESWPAEEKLRLRWSCSIITTLAAGTKTPSSALASEKWHFHLGSLVRRVRACRTGDDLEVLNTHALFE